METTKGFELKIEKPSREDSFGAVIDAYEAMVYDAPALDPAKAGGLEKALIRDGGLNLKVAGHDLRWIQGLTAFCRHDGSDVISDICERHSDVVTDLYQIALEQCDEFPLGELQDSEQDPAGAGARGALLSPELPLGDRQFLTLEAVSTLLRPYHQAKWTVLKIFFKQIAQAHRSGKFVMFRREADRGYGLVLPGYGFDGLKSYRIPRQAYRQGFGYSETELDYLHFPDAVPSFNAQALVFLSSGNLPEFCVAKGARKQSKGGRPLGSGYHEQDEGYVERMRSLIISGKARSIVDAARQAAAENPDGLAGGGTYHSKLRRLCDRYRARYPNLEE